MINRTILTGYVGTAIEFRHNRDGKREAYFMLHHRNRRPTDTTGNEYVLQAFAVRPQVVTILSSDVKRGDFILVEGQLVGRRVGCASCGTDYRAYCCQVDMVYNLTRTMEGRMGEKREERIARMAEEMLALRIDPSNWRDLF